MGRWKERSTWRGASRVAGAALLLAVATQARGELPALLERWSWPVEGVVTSLHGPRGERFHAGVDVAAPEGRAVVAGRRGRVVKAGNRGAYGLCVELVHADGWTSRYGHLSAIEVAVGDEVTRSTPLGRVGQTGNATGPHVHYEIRDAHGRPVNPAMVAR